MSSDLSAEITAIATVALAVFAFAAAILATLAFRKQTQEISLLQQQMEEQASERRKDQASRVYLSLIETRPENAIRYEATVMNTSEGPIYDADLVWFPFGRHLKRHDEMGVLMPGDRKILQQVYNAADVEGVSRAASLAVAVQFRDAANITWKRDLNGDLSGSDPTHRETPQSPFRLPLEVPLWRRLLWRLHPLNALPATGARAAS
jgi:C4-dicarboxylate-specific signal transduction histidine kinase